MRKEEIFDEIKEKIRQYFALRESEKEFVPGKTKIYLSGISYGADEVIESLDSLLSTWVTQGKKVKKFEEVFSAYIGSKHGTMVNSGSSANLVALSVLANENIKNPIKNNDEIISGAVTWSTTISSIAKINAVPYLVDANIDNYNIDPAEIEKHITKKTRAIMAVHLLGNPCDMKHINEIAEVHGLYVIEDCCEAHGAEISGKKVGSFSDLSTFSFFFAHHLTTIEGGMVLTSNKDYYEISKALRAYGWIRDMEDNSSFANKHPEIDNRFFFLTSGYNMRPTEIQGSFGIHQIKKLEKFIEKRRENAKYFTKHLEQYCDHLLFPQEQKDTSHAWFGYPITVKKGAKFTKKDLKAFLEQKNIETRALMAGDITKHPMMNSINYKKGDLKNSDYIMKNSFFFSVHQSMSKEEREYIVSCFDEFFRNYL